MLPAGVIERIRSMLRGELGVSLLQSDGSAKNQDALEVLQEILFDAGRESDTPVLNLEAWAVTITENRIADYLRAVRPRHFSMRNRLRYFVRHTAAFAEISATGGRMAGPAEWIREGRAPADAIDVAVLVHRPSQLRHNPPGGDPDCLSRADWEQLLDALFRHLGKPVLLNDLAAMVCAVLRIEEVRAEPLRSGPDGETAIDLPDPRPALPDLETREILRGVWSEIVELLPRQRIALLLNMGDDGDPLVFSESEIVTEADICRVLGLTGEQWAVVLSEAPTGDGNRCAALLRMIPLADLAIARLLGATRDQVIGLRRKARERLARRMGYCGGNKTARRTPSKGRSS
ncbi:MAG TPA: hypothetical protein VML19_10955 [Verrucomicrobiae bacterium]|nr:hypothetical protein [Verrucomicrobiae bacterium]